MKNSLLTFLSILFSISFSAVFMTELTDPQNSSDAGRYVELYNNGESDVDLSSGWKIQRWTNGNADPTASSIKDLTGIIPAGGFYIICNDAGKFSATYGFEADQDIGTGGAADSNGDDNMAILDPAGAIVDMFGVAGEDGSGTGHEFEDGRAERAEGVTDANSTWDETEWNIDNDSGGGDGNQYAPEGYDPGSWIGAGSDPLPSDVTFDLDGLDDCGFVSVTGTWDGWSGWGAHTDNSMTASIPAGDQEFTILCVDTSIDGWWDDIWGSSTQYSAPIDGACWNGNYDYANYTLNVDGSGDALTVSYCAGSCDATCGEGDPLPSDVTFDLDGLDDCGFVSVTGSWDGWSGWGATPDNGMTLSISPGDHEFVILCVNTAGEWWNDIWGNSTVFNAPIDGACWNGNYDYANYTLNVDGSGDAMTVSYCAGSCDATCPAALVNVTFSVDMSFEGVTGDIKIRTSTVNGEYNPSEWYVMDDSDGDMIYVHTLQLEAGTVYGYNFNDSDGSGYESGSSLGDCAGGTYGNDRFLTPGDSDMVLDTVCWESCSSCPAIVEGCTDNTATNYDPDATVDDGSCEYEDLSAANLFISEAAEGSSNNKYLEIYNGSDALVDLSGYAYPTVSNAPQVPGEYEYWNTFDDGAEVTPGDVYVICHGSSGAFIQAECDETYTYLSNGDDGLCLVFGSDANYEVLDCVGDWNGDPGSGWDVAGVSAATKDHTIVRKAEVVSGNSGDWSTSAGTNEDDSEWVVFDQNTWDYVGSHPHDFNPSISGCMDANATNYDASATEQSYNEFGTSTCTYASCNDIPTATGCLWADATSSEWWEGWWNCSGEGVQVCGLGQIVFEVDLPDDVNITPHVQGTYNGWCGNCYNNMTDDDGDGIWTHVQYFNPGDYHEYKFASGDWGVQETVPAECGTGGDYSNRTFTTGDANTSQTLSSCWGSCDAECSIAPATATVEFTVDMNFVDQPSADYDNVVINGSWNGWGGWGVQLYDEDGDGVFTGSAEFDPGSTFEYVVAVTGSADGWSGWGMQWGECVSGTNYSVSVGEAGSITSSSAAPGNCHELSIFYDFGQDVTGFQFDLSGVTIVENTASGGAAAEYFDLVSSNATTVIGISFSNTPIPAGAGTLTNLMAVGDVENVTLENVTVTDGNAQEVASSSEGLTIYVDCITADVNFDGLVNVLDVMDVLNHILDIVPLSEEALCAADVFQDGMINVIDIVNIVPIILGDTLAKGNAPSSIDISYNSNYISIESDGKIAGLQLEYSGIMNLDKKYLPDGWELSFNDHTILIFSVDGSELIDSKLFDFNGNMEILSAIGAGWNGEEIQAGITLLPMDYTLNPVYPNPFNPVTTVSYELPKDTDINLSVFDIEGKKLTTLTQGIQSAGSYSVEWNAMGLSSGVYFVKLNAGEFSQTQKLMLVK